MAMAAQHGGKPAHASNGWAVNGLVVDNSGGWGTWEHTILVNGVGARTRGGIWRRLPAWRLAAPGCRRP